jgi:glucose-1-phosphate thymidylyltransferase
MKAIIPLAGIGSRLRPHTHTQPKALVPVAGKPILGHIMDGLIEAGITDFILVIGYLGSKIQEYVKNSYTSSDLRIQFVIQEPREGIGHSVWTARELFKSDEEILIQLGDSILNLDYQAFFQVKGTNLAIKKVSNPDWFGIAELKANGKIKKVIEKPKIPKSNQALVGLYKISNIPLLLQCLDELITNNLRTYGEFHLTDALMLMIEKGEDMKAYEVLNWFDCGKMDSLLNANAILLNKPEFRDKSKFKFPNTIIIPPVSLGKNCKIRNSVIGPNVAIGDDTIVAYSIVRNSIIGSFSELNTAVLNKSVIGNDTLIRGHSNSLNIGDNTEINFNA